MDEGESAMRTTWIGRLWLGLAWDRPPRREWGVTRHGRCITVSLGSVAIGIGWFKS